MRNFDERRTEIFRRSDERIRTRRLRRRQALLLCAPLIVTVAVFALWPRNKVPQNEELSTPISVEIHDYRGSYFNSDTVQVNALALTLENAFTVTFEEDLILDSSETAPLPTQSTSSRKQPHTIQTHATYAEGNIIKSYRILFFDKNDNTVTYRLTGPTLENLNTEQSVTLTAEATAELYALLEQLR